MSDRKEPNQQEILESLLHDALRKGRVDRLFEAADRLASVPLPPLTEAEIESEVWAVRAAHDR